MALYKTRALYSASPLGPAGTYLSDVTVLNIDEEVNLVSVQANFTWGSGGTTCKAFVQTTLDGGLSWFDIMCFAFTTASAKKISAVKMWTALAAAYTPLDGTLTDDTIKDGVIGDRLRVKMILAGTYVTSGLVVTAVQQ